MACAVVAAVLFGGVSMAAAEDAQQMDVQQAIDALEQLRNAPVVEATCLNCHADLAKTKNYASEIEFSHAYHVMIQCSGCHSRFPHRPEAVVEKPTMKQCFNCHDLRHGPMGLVASGTCSDCHKTAEQDLRPAFHTFGWKGEPHVKPAEKEFNTRCAMCHDQASCDDCHEQEGIDWAPASWDYDAGDGCLACHGSQTLTKASTSGPKSFFVTGIDASAHRDVTCQQCHVDFRYDDKESPSKSWQVNAGYACADCHAKQKEKALSAPVDEWKTSIHYAKLVEGNVNSATCASCHGGHFIMRTDTEYAQQIVHGSAYRMCARCHKAAYTSYDDYYHGDAYKQGNPDAPACWQCHADHEILPQADPKSTVSDKNINATCGQEGCHKGSDENFGDAAKTLIHQKSETLSTNPLRNLLMRVRSWVG